MMPQFTCRGHRLFYRQEGSGELLLILPGNTASSHHRGELGRFARFLGHGGFRALGGLAEGRHPPMWSRAGDFRREADHFLETCGV